ncbi:MAG: carboxypeptidase-like regulatory domain-containing protein [bacterium]|nr:carboxypeptidase-like regulatory domain-containing protein [bacterium]
MKTVKIISTVAAIILFVTTFSFGQNSEHLKGKIVNENMEAVPYANVAVYKSADSTLIKGDFCNKDGEFEINNIPNLNYYLVVSHISYENATISDPNINTGMNCIKTDFIILCKSNLKLKEVNITATRINRDETVKKKKKSTIH